MPDSDVIVASLKTQFCQVIVIDCQWQDWILDDGVSDNDRGHFRRDEPPVN